MFLCFGPRSLIVTCGPCASGGIPSAPLVAAACVLLGLPAQLTGRRVGQGSHRPCRPPWLAIAGCALGLRATPPVSPSRSTGELPRNDRVYHPVCQPGGLVAENFGARYMATLLGLSFVVHQLGSLLGTWGGGLIFDLFGSYDPAWQIGALTGFAAGVVQILAGGPTRRQDSKIMPAVATA